MKDPADTKRTQRRNSMKTDPTDQIKHYSSLQYTTDPSRLAGSNVGTITDPTVHTLP
jgi:hypothetical protein